MPTHSFTQSIPILNASTTYVLFRKVSVSPMDQVTGCTFLFWVRCGVKELVWWTWGRET